MAGERLTYPPINRMKPVVDDLWVVDGPEIMFGPPWPKLPFSTRMTIVRLTGGRLFVHSPTPLTAELQAEVSSAGDVTWLIGPNRLHYWWLPDWKAAFAQAEAWLAPRIREQAGERIDFEARELTGETGYGWDDGIATLPVASNYMTEFVFFHEASRTLVLTDLIENFEPGKLGPLMRLMTWVGGVLDPDGAMPRDMRMTFRGRRPALRVAVERMIAWAPERVILAHGRWYQTGGAAELARAFRWLL